MQSLFRGYVPTKNKACMMPYKDKPPEQLMTLEEVSSLPEYAGILADDVVLIDIDDKEEAEILLDIVGSEGLRVRVMETSRGAHFYFKNRGSDGIEKSGTKKRLACGLTADIKVGSRNSYSILKFDGKERKILRRETEGEGGGEEEGSGGEAEGEGVQTLPKWLTPVASKTDFLTLGDGDGRNQALFNYILTLQSHDFSVEEARETLRIINAYVLPEPLDDNELETLMRDDAFKKPVFFRRNQFLFDRFARFLKNNNHIVKIHGRLHVYKDGVYVNGHKEIENQMIRHIPDLSRAKRAEVLSYIDIMIDRDEGMAPANYIAFKNGIYNLAGGGSDELEAFGPEIVITNKIPHDYNPHAYSEVCDRTLTKLACGDPAIRALIEECIGYCFYRRNEMRKAIILTGEKENGKSTFLSMLETLLGRENIVGLDLKELGERFKTAQLFGKLANIGDDIGDEFIPNPSVFKKLSAGNVVNAEFKGEDAFDFASYAKLIFSANDIPRIKDKSGAVLSRLVIIPFNARFSKDDPDFDPYIKYKLLGEDVMEYLIKVGLEGLRRLLENRGFTESEKVAAAISEYEETNNPILLFFAEEPKIFDETTTVVYQNYRGFCMANSYSPMSNIEFSKQVKRLMHADIVTKMVKGRRFKVFKKKEKGKDGREEV